MRELLVATSNPGKYLEVSQILDGLDLRLVFLGELGIDASDFVEDGETFKDNAFKKAAYFREKIDGEMWVMGEDSGILVSALPGELGVKTRRWGAGEHASDQEWIDHFMARMEGVEDRRAQFVSSVCLLGPETEEYFEGRSKGAIAHELAGDIIPGIPLSSVFIPEGYNVSYEALGPEEKNRISHRASAVRALREWGERQAR